MFSGKVGDFLNSFFPANRTFQLVLSKTVGRKAFSSFSVFPGDSYRPLSGSELPAKCQTILSDLIREQALALWELIRQEESNRAAR